MAAYTTALFAGFTADDKSRLLGDLKRLLGALDALEVAQPTVTKAAS
jgi:hypothetical protein